jgi:hypothetical protein
MAACAPDIAQNPQPATVVVEFDPGAPVPVVPSPNDLALDPTTGKVRVPFSPTDTPAQTEFNQQYLDTLNGFPFESTASVAVSGPLQPATVNATSVIGLDITAGKSAQLSPVYNAASNGGGGSISIPPPTGGWVRAHRYAIALIAGPRGLQGSNGEAVVGSPTWELVSSPSPLVTNCPNDDRSSPRCALAVDIIPSALTDPTSRRADQLTKAQRLEAIRASYAPLIAQIEQMTGAARAQIPIVWTFTIVDAGEVTFDPANAVIPFPNDVVRAGGKVTLPNPKTGKPLSPADCATGDTTIQLYCGLNTLDGFSTIAPPISENSDTAGAVEQANVDANSLSAATAGLIRVASSAPMAEQTTPAFTPCLNCLSSASPTGVMPPQQLQWRLDSPLDEKTTYVAWLSSKVKDSAGKSVIASPAFALVRLANPLIANGHSTVNILSDTQATQLEPLRAALQPALLAIGLPRTDITLAWAFTTQSEASQLDALRAYPAQLPQLPDSPLYVFDATAQYMAIAASPPGIADVAANIGKILVGAFLTPVAVTGPGGTFDLMMPQVRPVTFTLAIPKTTAPSGGYPLTVFGHAFTRAHGDFLAIAGALADPLAGAQATIATDVIFHGERSSCTGSKTVTMAMPPTDDAA